MTVAPSVLREIQLDLEPRRLGRTQSEQRPIAPMSADARPGAQVVSRMPLPLRSAQSAPVVSLLPAALAGREVDRGVVAADEGYEKGRTTGLEEGKRLGRAQGLQEGRDKGLEEGRQEGLVAGREEGREEGFQRGLEQGRADALRTLEREAQQMAERLAQERSATLVQEATAKAEEVLREKTRQLEKNMKARQEQLDALLRDLPVQLQRYFDRAEDDMLALVHDAVGRTIGDTATSLEGLRAQLRRSVAAWHGHAPLSVHLHPGDLELLRGDSMAEDVLKSAGFSDEQGSLRWVADAHVGAGGCVLVSSEGALDARLEVQMQAFTQRLLQARQSRLDVQAHAETGKQV